MKRSEPKLARAFQKDPQDEDFLARFNNALVPFEQANYQDLPESYPCIYIVGTPRSGTTLASQLLSFHLDVGYVSNLVAAFWQAPVTGLRLAKKLLPANAETSYASTFGRTQGPHEPHEFGYFWSQMLGYNDMQQREPAFEDSINWQNVCRVLINMTHSVAKPLVFKPFLLSYHITRTVQMLPKSIFVRITRDPLDNALSILKMRRKYARSLEQWVSLKPKEYPQLKDMSPFEQIAGQVHFLNKMLDAQLQQLEAANYLNVPYERLCDEPRAVIADIQTRLAMHGSEVTAFNVPARFDTVRYQDRQSDDYQCLAQAFNMYKS
ncbi:MAG: sulfotransferase [Deinococcota bacterium]